MTPKAVAQSKDEIELMARIGQSIKKIRLARGLSQVKLAKLLKISPSNINQIESGRRNLSLATISQLSQALKTPIIGTRSEVSLQIKGGRRLAGTVELNSAKNSVCFLLIASLLNRGRTVLNNLNQIEEVLRLLEVLKSLQVKWRWLGPNQLEIIRPAKLQLTDLNQAAAGRTRSAILLVGALAKEKQLELKLTGGCQLGLRTNTAHYLGLSQLGLTIDNSQPATSKVSGQLKSSRQPVVMYESSDSATGNLILAASQIAATTTIKAASANYQVQDLCFFLQKLGVKISGIGTTTLTINGLAKPARVDIDYCPLPDPIEAMTFVAAAVTTDSSLTIKSVPIDFLEIELLHLACMGLKFDQSPDYLAENGQSRLVDLKIKRHRGRLKALADKIHCRPYPGLNIDNLPYFVPIAATATGNSLIHDWVYEDRAFYYQLLGRLGAEILLADPHRVYVNGPTIWQPATINCPPALRPASIILVAMLAASGTSNLIGTYTINRGYYQVAERLTELGADIKITQTVLNS